MKTKNEELQSKTLQHILGSWKGLYLNEESLSSYREDDYLKELVNKTCQHFFVIWNCRQISLQYFPLFNINNRTEIQYFDRRLL